MLCPNRSVSSRRNEVYVQYFPMSRKLSDFVFFHDPVPVDHFQAKSRNAVWMNAPALLKPSSSWRTMPRRRSSLRKVSLLMCPLCATRTMSCGIEKSNWNWYKGGVVSHQTQVNILRWQSHPISWNRATGSVSESQSSDEGSHEFLHGSR